MFWRGVVLVLFMLGAGACSPARVETALPTVAVPEATLTTVVLPSAVPNTATPSSTPTATVTLPPSATPTIFHIPEAQRSGTPTPPYTHTPPGPSPTPTVLGPTLPGRIENFELVGRHALGSRGWNTGLALAGPCAYIGNRRLPQIAIVDVSNPAEPALAGELVLSPGSRPVELRTVPDLDLLVVMNFSSGITFITYDIRDCFNPRPMGSLGLGVVPHEFYLWRDPARPERLLAYAAMYYDLRPDLHVIDLTDLAAPRWLGSWSAPAAGVRGSLHALTIAPDGRLAYLALTAGGLLLADVSDFADGVPDPAVRVLRDAQGFAPAPAISAHTALPLANPRYVLVTEEVYPCPFAGLFVADVQTPARPQIISRFRLPEAAPPCAGRSEPSAVFTAHNPLLVGDLAFITWYGGGLQVLDFRDPAHPVRVGQYVPDGAGAAGSSYLGSYAVQLWSFPILREGLLYVSDIQSGLHILRYTGPGAAEVNIVPLAEGNVSVIPATVCALSYLEGRVAQRQGVGVVTFLWPNTNRL